MSKVKVRLKHTCNAPEHPGAFGDVISVDADLAESWEEKGGAVIVDDETPLTSEAKAPKVPKAPKDEK
jgi:hypothetical protein